MTLRSDAQMCVFATGNRGDKEMSLTVDFKYDSYVDNIKFAALMVLFKFNPPFEFKNYMDGVEAYVDEKLCGTILVNENNINANSFTLKCAE